MNFYTSPSVSALLISLRWQPNMLPLGPEERASWALHPVSNDGSSNKSTSDESDPEEGQHMPKRKNIQWQVSQSVNNKKAKVETRKQLIRRYRKKLTKLMADAKKLSTVGGTCNKNQTLES